MSGQPVKPGELLTTVALELGMRGLEVRGPEDEDSRCLTLAGLPGMRGNITVDDDGSVLLECWPAAPADADPALLAVRAEIILGGGREGWVLDGKAGRSGFPVISTVGPAVRAAGLAARMVIYPDYHNFEVLTLVIVTSPSRPGLGEIRIADDGVLIWECHFPPGTGPGDIAHRTGNVVACATGIHARQAAR
ncbi:MAG TPA: hypothetical protein VMV07_09190 [Streptosporangiaceae bacterium]|nr:hypothetical protein [Streptosporangiaceae bacterium]